MTFTSPQFIVVLISVLICWYIFPSRFKKHALLVFSYYFAYLLGGLWTVLVLLCVTLLTYFCALILPKTNHKKTVVSIFAGILVILLIYGRQSDVVREIISKITGIVMEPLNVVSMVGLSYYVLSAISYVVDVYRGDDEPDRNFADVALWLSFFPKITAGPIERHGEFKKQLLHLPESGISLERIKRGLLICSLGYFYKMIIADRMAVFVNTIYPDAVEYYGFTLFVTMILYSLEIYFDFSGYSLIAFGISYVMDLKITKNFEHPYFARGVSEFWRRWHISLSSWLKDYVYIPLGGSRKGKFRQCVNLLITFVISGIWHGAGLTFIIWGGLHAAFQIFEKLVWNKIKIPDFINRVLTFLAVSFAWIFFRSDSFRTSKIFIKRMLMRWNPEILTDGTLLNFGVDKKDWCVLLLGLGTALIVEILQYKGISIYEKLQHNVIFVRWLVYYLIIIVLLVFGIYGTAYDANNFIYFRF